MTTPASVFVGDDWSFLVTFKDSSDAPLNLTSYTPGGQFFQAYQLGAAMDMTVGTGITIVDAAGGKALYTVPRATTSQVPAYSESDQGYPTRLQVWITGPSPSNARSTPGLIAIKPLDPRTAPL